MSSNLEARTVDSGSILISEHNEEFTEINTQVLAISTDSHHTHLAWTKTSRNDGNNCYNNCNDSNNLSYGLLQSLYYYILYYQY